MPAATAQKSYGTTVTGTTAGLIGGLTGASLSGVDVNNIPTTAWDGDGWATFIGGVKDGGTIELSGRADTDDVGQKGLIDNMGAKDTFTIALDGGDSISAGVIIGGYNVSLGEDDAVEFSCSCKVTGAITHSAGI